MRHSRVETTLLTNGRVACRRHEQSSIVDKRLMSTAQALDGRSNEGLSSSATSICMPCSILSPIITNIAQLHRKRVERTAACTRFFIEPPLFELFSDRAADGRR